MTRRILFNGLGWNVHFTTHNDVCAVRHLHSVEALNAGARTVFSWLASFKVLVCSWLSVLSVLCCIWLAAHSPEEQESQRQRDRMGVTAVIRCPSCVPRRHRLDQLE